jgi:pimeloyl-ACP methyl ester carboxylesterase
MYWSNPGGMCVEKQLFDQIYRNVTSHHKKLLEQFRTSHPEKTLTFHGAHWRYLTGGEGERAVLFIPGSWHVADIWFMNIMEFEKTFHVISPTYPGVTTMNQLVAGIVEILHCEQVSTVDVVGHSFGGMMAQCLVRIYPEKVRNLILSNTDFPHNPRERKRKIEQSSVLPESEFLSQLKTTYSQLIEPVHPSERAFWKAFFDELFALRITKDEFLGFLRCAYDYHKNYSFAPHDLRAWPGKILLLESTNDQYFPESQREALRAVYPQARIHTFQNGGHTPSISRRAEFNSLVGDFLKTA